jgi:hypothetical protein
MIYIDRVIDHLLQQNVTPVVIVRPIPNPPNVHPRAQPDMLQTRQRLNFALVVNVFASVSHTSKFRTLTIVHHPPIAKPNFDNLFQNLFTLIHHRHAAPRKSELRA